MKKLLLGLGSVASVIAPIAAVISCGVKVSIKSHGDAVTTSVSTGGVSTSVSTGGDVTTGALATTVAVDSTLATTVNANITNFGGRSNLTTSDIVETEKITNFVFGSMHPVTYDYAVSYTLAAKTTGLKLEIGGVSIINTGNVTIKAGDKLVLAAKMPIAHHGTTSPAMAMPEIQVILATADGVAPTDLPVTNQKAIEKLTYEILLPVFPEIRGKI